MDKLTIREATLSDKDDVVRINADVYEGRDYIADRYEEFITCANTTSYVALMGGKIVAFITLLLIDDSKTVVTRAGRTSPEVAGKGVYKALKTHGLLEAQTRGATENVFSVANVNLAIYSHSFRLKNKEILNKSMIRILVDASSLPTPSEDDKINLHEPDDREMESYFSHKKIKTYLFPKDVIVCSWVPYRLMPSNLPHMRRPHDNKLIISDVTVDVDGNVHGMLSTSGTFQCVDPPYFTDLDIHGTDVKSLKQHLLSHFEIIRKIAKGVVSILVFIEQDLDRAEFNKAIADLGLEESVWFYEGGADRTYCEQLVFESKLQ